MSKPQRLLIVLSCLALAAATGCASSGSGAGEAYASNLKPDGPHAYRASANLMSGTPARNEDGTINVVIEIPAGTNAKWEVSPDGSKLVWEFTGDQPRIVDFLPYPGNYGMIPRTLLDEEGGGDGGALDVLVLGPAVPRGAIVRAKAIGVIRLLDRGEQDDKILAVMEGPTFGSVISAETLEVHYPGAADIVKTWFRNAHGENKLNVLGLGSRAQADNVIDYANTSYKRASGTD